ncbi:hypothetical protein DICSQDRAFT_56957 [Dichomitus squalens LYAD-421 SS1]|uniref:uncharacterized protein n=1 Tax=Dichomitus squalens (strain LYAD-421) TaxID=732165 RepID=UPI000441412D|nr:uncharacterized protein DICSQDRAFT_56957 [Dichomitus squalens LYAD-421 SS1]EJF63140.1 hypothetical protein DICSQDRAFT_56957 [Dichomitus squalens LYAD-421 SS1]
MRVKVESVAPLPHLKAWFTLNAIPTVHDLKTALCIDLLPFRDAAVHAQQLTLLLDDFELLDSSPIDVVRDGDLIVIKKAPAPAAHKRKAAAQGEHANSPARKRSKTNDGRALSKPPAVPPSRARPKRHTPPASSSESSSESGTDSSGSESSSSDSDSSSDSESDSSTSSDSSSSSTSSSAPSVHLPRRRSSTRTANGVQTGPKEQVTAPKPAPGTPPVPPGQGKPSTHSRNLRRRRKKLYERIALTAEPASVNEIPLGTRARTLEPPATAISTPSEEPESQQSKPAKSKGKGKAREGSGDAEPPTFMMASLSNKNKRRGFKDALIRGVPAKITFTDGVSVPSTSSAGQVDAAAMQVDADADALVVAASLQAQETPRRTQQPRLVPPSEKQERGLLPPNMFVTSIDVEEGMWLSRRKNKKKKQKQPIEEPWDQEADATFAEGLPYDDECAQAAYPASNNANGAGTNSDSGEATERAVVAARWDSLRKITDKSQVSVGATVAWKALGINSATLTPEMLLHIARVLQCGDQLIVQPITEAGTGGVSFGGVVVEEEGGATEETFEWADVFQGDWRLVVSH